MPKKRLFGGDTPKTGFLGLSGPPGPPRERGFTSTPRAGRGGRPREAPPGPLRDPGDPETGTFGPFSRKSRFSGFFSHFSPVATGLFFRKIAKNGYFWPKCRKNGFLAGIPQKRGFWGFLALPGLPARGVLHQPLAPGPRGSRRRVGPRRGSEGSPLLLPAEQVSPSGGVRLRRRSS